MIVENKKRKSGGAAVAFFGVAAADFALAGTSPHREFLFAIGTVFLVLGTVMFVRAKRST